MKQKLFGLILAVMLCILPAMAEQNMQSESEDTMPRIPQIKVGDQVYDLHDYFTDSISEYLAKNQSRNRFNLSTYIDGKYVNEVTGAVMNSDTNAMSDIIDIIFHGSENIVISMDAGYTFTNLRYFFYDADMNPISGGINPTKMTSSALNRDYAVLAVPSDSVYMRFSNSAVSFSENRHFQVEYGSTPTEYSEYSEDTSLPELKELIDSLADEIIVTVPSRNRFNLSTYIDGKYVNEVTGAVMNSDTNAMSDIIDISSNDSGNIVISMDAGYTFDNLRYFFYDADMNPISGGRAPTKQTSSALNRDYAVLAVPSDSVYMRFSNSAVSFSENRHFQVEYGSTPTEYSEYEGDNRMISNSLLVSNPLIHDLLMSALPKNLYNKATYIPDRYVNDVTGEVKVNDSHGMSAVIDISLHGSSNVVHSSDAGYLYTNLRYFFYDINMNPISGGIDPTRHTSSALNRDYAVLTVPTGAVYMRFSNAKSWFTNDRHIQIEYGNEPTEYREYGEREDDTPDIQMLQSMTFGKKPAQAKRAALNSGETIIASHNAVQKNQKICFIGKINGDFGAVIVGHGQGSYGYYIKVDGTNMYYGSNGETATGIPHGLTISDFICVNIEVDALYNIKTIIMSSVDDNYFERTQQINSSWKADVFATSEGTSFEDVVLTWESDDYKCPLWVFGDSYMTSYTRMRWPYYITRWGYNNLLYDCYPGCDASSALTNLISDLTQGTPKYLLWFLGMNNPDSASAINADWLNSTNRVISICEEKGIELILCTCPAVTNPVYKNDLKNAWVRESGIRYVDFAEELSTVSGWILDDGVHPNILGGKIMALKLLKDVPEIMQGK